MRPEPRTAPATLDLSWNIPAQTGQGSATRWNRRRILRQRQRSGPLPIPTPRMSAACRAPSIRHRQASRFHATLFVRYPFRSRPLLRASDSRARAWGSAAAQEGESGDASPGRGRSRRCGPSPVPSRLTCPGRIPCRGRSTDWVTPTLRRATARGRLSDDNPDLAIGAPPPGRECAALPPKGRRSRAGVRRGCVLDERNPPGSSTSGPTQPMEAPPISRAAALPVKRRARGGGQRVLPTSSYPTGRPAKRAVRGRNAPAMSREGASRGRDTRGMGRPPDARGASFGAPAGLIPNLASPGQAL